MFIGNFVVFLFIMIFNCLGHLNISKNHHRIESEEVLDPNNMLSNEEKSFNKQKKCYYWFSFVISTVGMIVGIIGVFFMKKANFLGCGDNGEKWLYLANLGNLFELFHILTPIFQCVIVVQTVYKIPSSFGYFNDK